MLSKAQQTVQHIKHFAHPANWAGFVLLGADVRLFNKVEPELNVELIISMTLYVCLLIEYCYCLGYN